MEPWNWSQTWLRCKCFAKQDVIPPITFQLLWLHGYKTAPLFPGYQTNTFPTLHRGHQPGNLAWNKVGSLNVVFWYCGRDVVTTKTCTTSGVVQRPYREWVPCCSSRWLLSYRRRAINIRQSVNRHGCSTLTAELERRDWSLLPGGSMSSVLSDAKI